MASLSPSTSPVPATSEVEVKQRFIGVNIQDLTADLAKSFGKPDTNGAFISQVVPGGSAEKAGIKAGDIVVEFKEKRLAEGKSCRTWSLKLSQANRCS